LQAIGLIISDDFLLHQNISRISTDDIVDRIDKFTLSIRKTATRFSFSAFFAVFLAKIVGQSGICYNFNMVDATNMYRNLENVSKIFRYNHDIDFFSRIEKYQRRPINMKEEMNLTNPLSLMEAGSDFNIVISEYIKGNKFTIEDVSKTYDFFKFSTPRIYINNPYEIYSRDVNAYHNNPESRMFYIVEPKQLNIDSTLKNYGSDL